jgi:hypothetical protein
MNAARYTHSEVRRWYIKNMVLKVVRLHAALEEGYPPASALAVGWTALPSTDAWSIH